MKKRVFIAHILPPQFIEKYRLSTAGCNFSFNLISGGAFDKVYSILGTYVEGRIGDEAFRDERFTLLYHSRLRSLGRVGRIVASIIEQCQIFVKIPKGTSVWFYNVTTINTMLYLLLRLFKRSVQVNVIVLDFTPVVKGFGLNRLYLKIINHCHGNIRLADSPLFTNVNSITLAGVVPARAGNEPHIEVVNNRFLLSGVLQEQISQISMVLKAFAKLPHCELHITGKADDEKLIQQYVKKYPNIIWHGNLSFQEYMDVMHSCTFQLSTRDPKSPENQCNFPSKVIETLLHNRIVVTTIKYPQIDKLKYFKVDSAVERFTEQIDNISRISTDKLMKYANQGSKVSKMFSPNIWNKAMTNIEEAR